MDNVVKFVDVLPKQIREHIGKAKIVYTFVPATHEWMWDISIVYTHHITGKAKTLSAAKTQARKEAGEHNG